MTKLLKKYRFTIVLMLMLVVLSFMLIPRQQELYLQADFELLRKKSNIFLIWTMAIGVLIVLFLALRKIENIRQAGNVLLGIVGLAIPFYFIFQTIFLSTFLVLNRIDFGGRVDKKYTTTFYLEPDKQTPMIYDFRTKSVLLFDNIRNTEKLKTLKLGDTVVMSFNKGILGIAFAPKISTVLHNTEYRASPSRGH